MAPESNFFTDKFWKHYDYVNRSQYGPEAFSDV